MLTIRQAQMDAFSRIEVAKFEEWVLAHLQMFFPSRYRAAGEPRLREVIRSGIERAASHDVRAKRDVCKYIDLMVVFGRGFDADPRFPWAREILASGEPAPRRMRDLFAAAQQYLRAC